jgi:hypothetical protein
MALMLGNRALSFSIDISIDGSPALSNRAASAVRSPSKKGRAQRIGRTLPRDSSYRGQLIRVSRRIFKRIPYGDGNSPAGCQHPQHLAQGLTSIRKKHQTKLADNGVEALIRER